MARSVAPRQGGAALLMMMLAVLLATSALLVARISSGAFKIRKAQHTQASLSAARDALLAYAATTVERTPGNMLQLPCPDIDDTGATIEGVAHTANCAAPGVTVIGRLPWRTLGLNVPTDGAKECLWYVVSGSHKAGSSATSSMINPDSNGQLQLYALEDGMLLEGALPRERPVALVIAAMDAHPGQQRVATTDPLQHCDSNFNAANFLEADSITGISNATLSSTPDSIDQLIARVGSSDEFSHNDRIASISRSDLARLVDGRQDYTSRIGDLGNAVAACVADYAKNNVGGSNDRRLPWPSPLSLSDYRLDGAYADADFGVLSGRLPDNVAQSNAAIGNTISQILNDCDSTAVPQWTATMLASWRNWKDHFFYVVAESFEPNSAVPNSCSNCLAVNGSGQYAALIIFSGSRLRSLSQVRDAPPIDVDTKGALDNYLEGGNLAALPYIGGAANFESMPSTSIFNDRLFCIDESLNNFEC